MRFAPPPLPCVQLPIEDRIEICIPTRGRTINVVCLLQALRTQTFTDWDLTILDDNLDDSLKNNFTLWAMISLLEMEGHRCRVIKGEAMGIPRAHNVLLAATKKNLIARIDDDTLPSDVDYLTLLVNEIRFDSSGLVGAVGGPIPHFKGGTQKDYELPANDTLGEFAAFETPFVRYVQPENATPRSVTALYSSFLFKRAYALAAGGYSLSYSRSAEKEETDFTVRIAFLGGRLVFHPRALLWHLRAPSGGTRSVPESERKQLFQGDYQNFVNRVRAMRDGNFDWGQEAMVNLTPFEKYTTIEDSDNGYIEV
jgi:GT2 family glycosyltransferase